MEEGPGMVWGNVDGETVPLDEEAIRVARYMTFGEILGHAKIYDTQKDYEEIEAHMNKGSTSYGNAVHDYDPSLHAYS